MGDLELDSMDQSLLEWYRVVWYRRIASAGGHPAVWTACGGVSGARPGETREE